MSGERLMQRGDEGVSAHPRHEGPLPSGAGLDPVAHQKFRNRMLVGSLRERRRGDLDLGYTERPFVGRRCHANTPSSFPQLRG